jgi:fructokinase
VDVGAQVTVMSEALVDTVVPAGGETVEHVGGSPANVAIGPFRRSLPVRYRRSLGPS